MSITPKLKPDLIIQRYQERPFRTSSALAMNSMFKQYNPRLAEKPMVTLELSLESKMTTANNPLKSNHSLQGNIGKIAEGIGDFFSALASADFQAAPKMSISPEKGNSQQRQAHPATLFAPGRLPTTPTPLNNNKPNKKKKLEQETQFKFKR